MEWIAGARTPPDGPYDADVVILALDRPVETVEAIASALAQTGCRRHVIIADQGSTTANLARLADAVADRPDATLVRLDRNYGVAGGRNRATAIGHGRVIVALDNDAEFATAATVADAVAALDHEPDLAALGFRIVSHASGHDDLSSWGYPIQLLARADEAFQAVTFVGAGHAIRRTAWDAAGGYDDQLFFCWEEYDFCLRAIQGGWRIRYDGNLVVRHKVSGERRFAWSETRWFYFVRNRLYIGLKSGASWASLAPRLAGYLVKGVRNGLALQTLRAVPAAYRMSRDAPVQLLSPSAKEYLRRHDRAHRGSILRRLRFEVLGGLPRPDGSTPAVR